MTDLYPNITRSYCPAGIDFDGKPQPERTKFITRFEGKKYGIMVEGPCSTEDSDAAMKKIDEFIQEKKSIPQGERIPVL